MTGSEKASAHDAVGQIKRYLDPTGMIAAPTGIIGVGCDIWFTSIANGRIGRLRTGSGTIDTFADREGAVQLPANIYPGSDDRVWFTSLGSDRLGSIDPGAAAPGSSIRTYSHPAIDKPVALKASADGNLWFSLRESNAIATIDPRRADPMSSLRAFSAPSVRAPSALFVAPRGRVWWVNAATGTIGSLDPAADDPTATITAWKPGHGRGAPRAWAIDKDDRLWVTTQDPPGLLSFQANGADPAATADWVTGSRLKTPDGIWFGSDGSAWLADTAANSLARFRPGSAAGGPWSMYGRAPDVDGPFDIKAGGNPAERFLWFTNKTGNSIGGITT